jgi:hypothetical protein
VYKDHPYVFGPGFDCGIELSDFLFVKQEVSLHTICAFWLVRLQKLPEKPSIFGLKYRFWDGVMDE